MHAPIFSGEQPSVDLDALLKQVMEPPRSLKDDIARVRKIADSYAPKWSWDFECRENREALHGVADVAAQFLPPEPQSKTVDTYVVKWVTTDRRQGGQPIPHACVHLSFEAADAQAGALEGDPRGIHSLVSIDGPQPHEMPL